MITRERITTAAAGEIEEIGSVKKVHAGEREIISAALLTDMVYFVH